MTLPPSTARLVSPVPTAWVERIPEATSSSTPALTQVAGIPRQNGRATKLVQALRLGVVTVTRVLRNALVSTAVGWLFAFCFTVGNIFSGESPDEQPYPSFVAANCAWFHGVFTWSVMILEASKLLREVFVGRGDATGVLNDQGGGRLTLFQSVLMLLGNVWLVFVVSYVAVVGGAFVLLTYLPEEGRKYKPTMYLNAFWGFFTMVSADVAIRHIYKTQTVRGLARSKMSHQPEQLSSQQTGKTKDVRAVRRSSSRYGRRRRPWLAGIRRFLQVYVQSLPNMLSALAAIIYVHLISLFAKITREWELLAFAVGSIALKLAMQEATKRHLLAMRRPVAHRMMVVLVSTPTILVDTQVRMLLLRLNNVTISFVGSALLAFTEISVRAVKSMVVQIHTRTYRQQRAKGAAEVASIATDILIKPSQFRRLTKMVPGVSLRSIKFVESSPSVKRSSAPVVTVSPIRETSSRIVPVNTRQQRYLTIHAAEIYADMYAEYLAMGCSYAILFFFWNHKQYQFNEEAGVVTPEATRQRQLQHLGIFAFQVGVEVVVDFVACTIEAAQGIELDNFDQNDPFLLGFMAMLAFSNVAISAGLYIHS